MFLSRSHLQASILSQCRLRNITWFSTQFTIHSSQLTAHSSHPSRSDFPCQTHPSHRTFQTSKRKSLSRFLSLRHTKNFLSVVSLDQSFQTPVNKTSPSNIPSRHETDSPHSNAVFPETKLPNQVPDQRACTNRPGGVSTSAMAPVRSSDLVLLTAAMNRFVHVRSVASPQPFPPSSNHTS